MQNSLNQVLPNPVYSTPLHCSSDEVLQGLRKLPRPVPPRSMAPFRSIRSHSLSSLTYNTCFQYNVVRIFCLVRPGPVTWSTWGQWLIPGTILLSFPHLTLPQYRELPHLLCRHITTWTCCAGYVTSVIWSFPLISTYFNVHQMRGEWMEYFTNMILSNEPRLYINH